VFVTSLSNGNFDGQGLVREKELKQSCLSFGVERVEILSFLDGPDEEWDVEQGATELQKQVEKIGNVKTILTFDAFGVSGHPNHKAAFEMCRLLHQKNRQTNVLVLHSKMWLSKYLGFLEMLISVIFAPKDVFFLSFSPMAVYAKMNRSYPSQFVWFRKLFVIFSSYSYFNSYTKL
jgi:N-acetylglucosaminylphosphatidylinositol deacetylase